MNLRDFIIYKYHSQFAMLAPAIPPGNEASSEIQLMIYPPLAANGVTPGRKVASASDAFSDPAVLIRALRSAPAGDIVEVNPMGADFWMTVTDISALLADLIAQFGDPGV